MVRSARELIDSDSEIANESTERPSTDDKGGGNARKLAMAVFVVYLVTRGLATVLIYRVSKAMAQYTTILMSIYWPLGIVFWAFTLCALRNSRLFSSKPVGLSWFSPWSEKASAQGPVPQHWFVLIAFCNQLCATFSAPPTPFIPVVLQTPLANLVALWTAIISCIFLKTRFTMVHYAGISLILYSCVVSVLVELQGPAEAVCQGLDIAAGTLDQLTHSNLISSEAAWSVSNATEHCVIGLPPYKDTTGQILKIPLHILVSMYTFYTLSQVPFAFVNVYKQKKLKQVNLDVAWAFWWQCAWQVLWGLVFIPACWIPWPTPSGHNEASFSTFGRDLADSWTCFMGRNPHPEITSCSAEPVYGWFAIYCFFNVSCNLALTWLIKQLSSTWASIGSILCGNLGGFFSQFSALGGKSAQTVTLEQWMALILSSVAMWIYNVQDERDVNGKSVYGQQGRGDHRYDTKGPMGLEPDSDGFQSDDEPNAEDHTTL
ncbi:crtp3 [Symbiodinium natans]|uniref:Crtp3 protein n=1 Tax=Symbiodinium natans TaxID=878477 RepID=A0A812JEC1_9DINO|nr:crtp3 [Symbiodinium natans]